jgi:hypothetical protein
MKDEAVKFLFKKPRGKHRVLPSACGDMNLSRSHSRRMHFSK